MTVRNLARLLVLIPLVTRGVIARGQKAPCSGEVWLPPRELRTREGYTVFLERPSIAPMNSAVFMPAWPTYSYDSLGSLVWSLAPGGKPTSAEHVPLGALVDNDGIARLVPWPKDIGAGPWLPVGVADDSGIAHVVWGSRDSVPMSDAFMVRSLWYARFDGREWSTPTRILSTEGTIMWHSAMVSPLVARGRSLHLIVGIQGEGLRYLRSDSGVWWDHHVSIRSTYTGYPHLAILSSGRLVVAVQGPLALAGTRTTSAVYITTSDDGGVRWSPPIQISSPDDSPAFDVRLVADGRDALSAFWYQQTDTRGRPAAAITLGGSPGRIYVAQSLDRGATWRAATPTVLIENANELQVLLRHDRSVLTVLADDLHERMLISRWFDGWSRFTVIDAKPAPVNPSLGMDDAQRPFLTWGIRRSHDWLGTIVTRLMPCR